MAPNEKELETVKCRVEIDGEEFVLRGPATADHVEELARVVNGRIRDIRRAQPNLPRHRVAILAALNLAEELRAVSKENAELMDVLEEAR